MLIHFLIYIRDIQNLFSISRFRISSPTVHRLAQISHIHWSMVLLTIDVQVIFPTINVTRPLSLRQQKSDISVWQHKSHRSSIKTTMQCILFIKHMGLAYRSKTQGHCKKRPLTWNIRKQHYNLYLNVISNSFRFGLDPRVVLGVFHYGIPLGEWRVIGLYQSWDCLWIMILSLWAPSNITLPYNSRECTSSRLPVRHRQ